MTTWCDYFSFTSVCSQELSEVFSEMWKGGKSRETEVKEGKMKGNENFIYVFSFHDS